jgi:hypothetical protein
MKTPGTVLAAWLVASTASTAPAATLGGVSTVTSAKSVATAAAQPAAAKVVGPTGAASLAKTTAAPQAMLASPPASLAREVERPVRALHGDLDLFRAWVDAEERALQAAIQVKRDAPGGVAAMDVVHADTLRADADAAWREALASYQTTGRGAGETLVFVRLHERVALRVLMEVMRPTLARSTFQVSAEGLDPVTARWIAAAFHAAVEGDDPVLNLHTRLLRERLAFSIGDQRARIFRRVLAATDRIEADLSDAGLPAGDAFVEAMLPGLAAIAFEDPCAPEAGAHGAGAFAPTAEDLQRLARIGIAMDDLRAEAEFDCGIASGGGEAAPGGGYGPVGDAMACLGAALGEPEEPADYGLCMAAGLGTTTPEEIGASTLDRARGCSNPLADGDDDRYEPFDFAKWYHEEFVEEELRKGESPVPAPPEDEDQKRREEINDEHDDSTIVKADVGLIADVVGAIVDAVKTFVNWLVDLFTGSDDQSATPQQDQQDSAQQEQEREQEANDQGERDESGDADGEEEPAPDPEDGGTTLPGPDELGGGGCADALTELAEDCLDRVLSQLPGHRDEDDLRREPGSVDPIVAYIWEGSDQDVAALLQGCGGLGTPGSSVGCAQLTDPPSACPDASVSAAARFFAEQARRDHFCTVAYCAPDVPCECTDELLGSAPPPGNPVGPGPGDPFALGLDLEAELGGSGPVPVLEGQRAPSAPTTERGGLPLAK